MEKKASTIIVLKYAGGYHKIISHPLGDLPNVVCKYPGDEPNAITPSVGKEPQPSKALRQFVTCMSVIKFFISTCVVTVAMVTCKHLRRGDNQQTIRPAPMIFRGIFGFPSNYNCFARIFDEPRRMRLQCTKNSDRLLNCKCHRRPGSEQLTCSCRKLHKNGSVPVELESKYVDNNAVFPTEPLEEQRPTL